MIFSEPLNILQLEVLNPQLLKMAVCYFLSSELLSPLHPNLVLWCTIMSWNGVQGVLITVSKVKGIVRVQIIREYLFILDYPQILSDFLSIPNVQNH